jgi:signal recognition particle GTPase
VLLEAMTESELTNQELVNGVSRERIAKSTWQLS